MRIFSTGRYPPGGYRFTDADGNLFEGDSVADVAAKVREYRDVNKFPPGDPEAEVNEHLCQLFPSMAVEVPEVIQNDRSIVARVCETLRGWNRDMQLKRRPELVDLPTAGARADQCVNCKYNVNWHLMCTPCELASTSILDPYVAPARPSTRLKGRACSVAGDDLSVAIFLNVRKTGSLIETDVPCWRKADPVDVSESTVTHSL